MTTLTDSELDQMIIDNKKLIDELGLTPKTETFNLATLVDSIALQQLKYGLK